MNEQENVTQIKLDRSFFSTESGSYVQLFDDIYRVTQRIDFVSVIGVNVKTGEAKVLLTDSLKPLERELPDNGYIHCDIEAIIDSDWKKIEERLKILQPLLKGATREEVIQASKQAGFHFTTIYRWLKNYINTGSLIGLLPKKRGRPSGTTRISHVAEEIMKDAINDHYLTKQRPAIQHVIEIVHIECKKRKIQPPSKNTIRSRIDKISAHERTRKQGMRSLARSTYNPVPGKFPNANYPLAVVQVDHTPMDIILVDDESRKAIGRPWVTLAIDVYSRMIVGYYLSLDPPSETSVAMTISHAITPKETFLDQHGVEARWPVWGVMTTLHVDNGADFRSDSLKRSCLPYNINIEFRPVKKTNYGGHIERLIGTVVNRVHSLPGTTFSNIRDRIEYDSDENAIMTFSEFEKWLITYITKHYHKKPHSALGIPPLKQWEMGMIGDKSSIGQGYPPKPRNTETILIDFLPIFDRTVQKTGVNIEGLNYYDHVLRHLINVKDSQTKRGKKHIFRRDPRDISSIWFYDDETQTYYKIPAANQNLPHLNIWEFRAAKAYLKKHNMKFNNDDVLLNALEEMQQLVDTSAKATKKARRKKQQKQIHRKYRNKPVESTPLATLTTSDGGWHEGEVEPF